MWLKINPKYRFTGISDRCFVRFLNLADSNNFFTAFVPFYANRIAANTTKHIYNESLNSFIEVKYLSINETSGKAAYNCKSTLAVTFLTEILENATAKKDKNGNIISEIPRILERLN